MQTTDNCFFEEYKRLDKLCSEIYSCQNGVSQYITEMEAKSDKGRRCVSSWDNDFRMLKHVRWVRNQIAHDSGDVQICETNDLSFVQEFYDRIFGCRDPLAQLRKALEEEEKLQRQRQKKQNSRQSTIQYTSFTDNRSLRDEHQSTNSRSSYSGHGNSYQKEPLGCFGTLMGAVLAALVLILLFI